VKDLNDNDNNENEDSVITNNKRKVTNNKCTSGNVVNITNTLLVVPATRHAAMGGQRETVPNFAPQI